MENEIIIYRSKIRGLFSTMIFLFLTAVLVSMNGLSDPNRILHIVGVIFFGLLSLLGLYKLLIFKRPVIILNDKGIEDKRFGCGPIAWTEIKSVRVYKSPAELLSRRSLLIDVKDFNRCLSNCSLYYRIVYSLRGKVGLESFIIDFEGLENKCEAAYTYAQIKLRNN